MCRNFIYYRMNKDFSLFARLGKDVGYLTRKPIIFSILSCFLFCQTAFGYGVELGMPKETFIDTFGNPEKEVIADKGEKVRTMLFYGDDYFEFVDDQLTKMDVITRRYTLTAFNLFTISIGDSFSTLLKKVDDQFELLRTNKDYDTYRYTGCKEDTEILVRVERNIISGYSVSRIEQGKVALNEFRAFFIYSFQPSDDPAENSIWPRGVKPYWKQVYHAQSADASSTTCCIPFMPEYDAQAQYAGKDCPVVARRLALTKYEEGSRFKQSIVSVIPKAGLTPGDEFSGLIMYNNVNKASCFAWEEYENGLLTYSKYLVSNSQDSSSETITDVRQRHKVYYVGGQDAISDDDWMTIVANRLNHTQAFSKERSEAYFKAEKDKYTFLSTLNPEYAAAEQAAEKKEKQDEQAEDQLAPVEEATAEPEESYIPGGRADNLSGIIRLKGYSPVSLSYEKRTKANSQEEEQVLMCDNSDFCDYTIRTSAGTTFTVYPGKNDLSKKDDGSWQKFYWFRGKAISGIDAKYPYVLPVEPGTEVVLLNDPREMQLSFVITVKQFAPVFAMRRGRVCMTSYDNSVLVWHDDGTFAAYMNVHDARVFPGDFVETGQMIGSCGFGKLSISIFYLDSNKIHSNSADAFTHMTPYIMTGSGAVKLETGVKYVSYIDTDIITREMSTSEKKKYLKSTSK